MKVPKFIQRWVLMEGYRSCYRIAFKICCLGFDNAPHIQQHLDRAKDELYSAATAFEKESKLISVCPQSEDATTAQLFQETKPDSYATRR